MKRLVILSFVLAACGDNHPGAGVDAHLDGPVIDSPMIDAADIDAPDIDAPQLEGIAAVRAAANGAVDIDIVDATVTYLKPAVTGASTTNDPAGFTIQVGNTGPGLFVAVDPTTTSPVLAVGDVVSFTVTMKAAPGSSARATAISDLTRSQTATDVNPLVQNVTAATDLLSAIGNYDGELVDITAATIASAFASSGSSYERANFTTAGVTVADMDLQLRMPATFRASLDLESGCVVAINNAPVGRFSAQAQVGVWTTTDLTVTSCPAPAVATATATDATHVTVAFSRNIDMNSVLANGSQFTISDGTNPLAVSAAALTAPRTITLTTAAQVSGTTYTVTAANTVEDTLGTPLATTLTATFTGYTIVIPTVMMAVADSATSVKVTFTRDIDASTVLANGTQFTIDNGLTVSAATSVGPVVTLTTSAQTPATVYTVTVATTVTDTIGTAVGAPLTAMFMGYTPPVAANHLVINEVDYDQAGTDATTFIEIFNPTNAAITLADYAVQYINGGTPGGPTGTEYGTRVLLSAAGTSIPAGGYLLIRNAAVAANGAMTIDVSGDWLQNGPDGIALINTTTGTLVDALHYGGGAGLTTVTITGITAPVSLVEAPVLTTTDTTTGSLGRFPNGADTDHASADWALRTTPTPGLTN